MRSLIMAVFAAASLGSEVVAQELKDLTFNTSQKPDPLFSIERVVTLAVPQYVYACDGGRRFNYLVTTSDQDYARQEYQRFRSAGFCDYLQNKATGYLSISSLRVTPVINPLDAPAVPKYLRQNTHIPEVAVLYKAEHSTGGEYFVVLSHPVFDGIVQFDIGRDLMPAIYGGQQ